MTVQELLDMLIDGGFAIKIYDTYTEKETTYDGIDDIPSFILDHEVDTFEPGIHKKEPCLIINI